nr:protein kinase-like domain, concanavalin A-like lectin/glucanase domain protein [Tanacetum cinerariifolium]
MGDANPIRTLGDYSKPSHKGYRNTIELPEGNNMDPSLDGRILLLVSLLNSFHREGLQNSAMTSLCSNNIKENLFLKHGIISRLNLNSSSWHRSLAPRDDRNVMFIEIIRKNDDSREEGPKDEGVKRLKIMIRKLDPIEDTNRGVTNFTVRIKGMHVFVGYFTYVIDFMIVEDISSIIDPRLSLVVLGKPYVEISNMTYDPPEGVVSFINRTDEIAYKMPNKIEQYSSLSDLEKEHTKSVYLRNEEDKRRGIEYVISKILRFYKECLELGPEYLTGVANEGEIT